MISTDHIREIMPGAKKENIERYFPFWLQFLPRYEVDRPRRLAAYFAQIAHESQQLNSVVENLNYSAAQLLRTWPRRFNPVSAVSFHRQPQKIANYVYANRGGNGPASSGDGWKYRGRGLIQLTFPVNYRACSRDMFKDDRLVINPDLVLEPAIAVESSLWFWKTNGLNLMADEGNLEKMTRRINGGLNGLEDRAKYYSRALRVFKA